MHLEQIPEQYKLSPELGKSRVVVFFMATSDSDATANILGIKEESRIGVIQALWNYIKINGLQDKVDRRRIRADDHLRQVSPLHLVSNHVVSMLSLIIDLWWRINCIPTAA
jgi:SWI/SNF-related matrix-associated actin-dependent regulator of chromatin subfamily D